MEERQARPWMLQVHMHGHLEEVRVPQACFVAHTCSWQTSNPVSGCVGAPLALLRPGDGSITSDLSLCRIDDHTSCGCKGSVLPRA